MKHYFLRAAPLILVCCMFVFVLSPSASAEPLNYRDYETSVTVDGDNDIVTVTFPSEYCFVSMYALADSDGDGYEDKNFTCSNSGTSVTFPYYYGWVYSVSFYPTYLKYIDLSNIPTGTEFTFNVGVDYSGSSTSVTNTPKIQCSIKYYDEGMANSTQQYADNIPYDWDVSSYSIVMDIPDGMTMADPRFQLFGWGLDGLDNYYSYGDNFGSLTVFLSSFTATMSISSLYRLQEQTGETNELLDEVNRQLEEQGKTLDDILNQQEQTNEKLDQLPGQIGDEMQGVLDQEKEEANNTGNGSIDDMIEMIPDYSTGLIKGIENLAGSLGYEGTECKLTMPALRIPALPGVTPEPITFMEEQEVDFEEWFNRMPSEIMAVTKAMFDIAVVVFCFIEFYDLISQLSNGAKRLEKE